MLESLLSRDVPVPVSEDEATQQAERAWRMAEKKVDELKPEYEKAKRIVYLPPTLTLADLGVGEEERDLLLGAFPKLAERYRGAIEQMKTSQAGI